MMALSTAATLMMNGLALAAILFLLASGLTLIFGLMDVLNFGHGALFLLGSYVFVRLAASGMNVFVALLISVAIGLVFGFVLERLFIQRLYGKLVDQFLITLGIGLLITESISIVWGSDFQPLTRLPVLEGTVTFLGGRVEQVRLAVIVLGVVVFLTMSWVLYRTRLGLIVRAGVQDIEMVQALGNNARRAFALMFSIGSGLAFLAGCAGATYFGGTAPSFADQNLTLAFVIAVVGGLGSFSGAAIGAVLIGLAMSFVGYYWSPGSAIVPVLLMTLVLVLRPQGLLQQEKAERL
jgi:branched-chain amino acid transport system permease protein